MTAAVGVGVALSLLLQLNQEALDLKVVRLVRTPAGGWAEEPAPARLRDREVLVLDVYGSLFYAGSRTLQARLPLAAGAEQAVVVLRLRGRTSLGATFFLIIAGYAEELAAGGGRLYLSGLDPSVTERLHRSGRMALDGPVRLFEAESELGRSTAEAYEEAEAWLVRRSPDGGDDPLPGATEP